LRPYLITGSETPSGNKATPHYPNPLGWRQV
jgi:hypothetical protein